MATRTQNVCDQDLDQLVSLFRFLSDTTRLSILLRLSEGERCVTSLCEELNLPQASVSHHLGLLKLANLVRGRRQGKQVFYALSERAATGKSIMAFSIQNLSVQVNPI